MKIEFFQSNQSSWLLLPGEMFDLICSNPAEFAPNTYSQHKMEEHRMHTQKKKLRQIIQKSSRQRERERDMQLH